ncbi:MAG: cytochrome c biogenesis heme-transporting ATPase CcmA [Halioglobus sp.]
MAGAALHKPAELPVLAVNNLSLERGGRSLFTDLSFHVSAGQLLQIDGANGTGKTSLMRILAGLSRYGYEGEVTRSSATLYLGHHTAVKGLLTPQENLRWHVSGRGDHTTIDIDAALEKVGLFGYEHVPSHQLSAGQQRRINLARLYLDCAPLWLLDEPFTAIDKVGVKALEARIGEHVGSGGAVVIVSHQPVNVSCDVQQLMLSDVNAP